MKTFMNNVYGATHGMTGSMPIMRNTDDTLVVNVTQNKYTKWYEQLVNKAKNRTLPKNIYTEKHHVIPHCMTQDNSQENLVEFTAREHYVAHLLLWRITMPAKWHNKMTMAIHMMVNGSGYGKQKLERSKYLMPSKLVEKYRLEWREHLSEIMKGEKNPFYGKTHSEETKALIKQRNVETKDIRSAKAMGDLNPMYGKQHTEEAKALISKKSKEYWLDTDVKVAASENQKKLWEDPEYRENQTTKRRDRWANMSKEERSALGQKSAATKKATGYKMSEKQKKKLSEAMKGKTPWNKGKKVGCFSSPATRLAGSKKAVATKQANGTMPDFKGEKNPFYGKTHSEETKEKIRATKAAKKLTNLPNNFESWVDIDKGTGI